MCYTQALKNKHHNLGLLLVICTIIFSNPKIKSNITVIEASPP